MTPKKDANATYVEEKETYGYQHLDGPDQLMVVLDKVNSFIKE
jgi:hypothetical protein